MNRLLLFLFILVILASCAVQVPPSGGPKDLTAPVVEKMIPKNKSLNFNTDEISIRFNKFILLSNVNEQLIISPPMDEKPELEISGKVLKIKHLVGLKPNTTYTINFGNAISDNHENNIIDNLHYVFSTGNEIDTNIITGKIQNSFSRKPEKNISVGIYDYDGFNDSLIYKQKPIYLSKTKDSGIFSIENIPNKKYYLIGFKDENGNIKYNKNEALFYKSDYILPNDSNKSNNFFWLFNPDPYLKNRIVDTFSYEKGKFCFLVFNPVNFVLNPVKNIPFFTKIIPTETHIDSILIFADQLKNDSIVMFSVKDSDTSFVVKVKPWKKSKLPAFGLKSQNGLELNDSFHIYLSNPLKSVDTTRLIFLLDTIPKKYAYFLNTTRDILTIYYPLSEKTNYVLRIKDSAFIDIFNQYSKKNKFIFTTRSIKDYSSLQVNFLLNPSNTNYIIQLISNDESTVLKEFSLQSSIVKSFEYLLPGTYKIKIIKDDNKNGKWDNGDYFLKQQPEVVYYHTETITLKAYWDLEQTIDLNYIINK